jgi:hypothetical protein
LSVLVEEKALFGVVAQRTHVGVALKTEDGHGFVRNNLQQNHLCTARHTAHCTYPVALLREPASFRALDLPDGAFLGLSMVIPRGN